MSGLRYICRLIGNGPVEQCPEDMLLLQQTFPLLFDIVEGDQLLETLTAFITDLLEKAKSPFSRNGSIPNAVQLDVHRTNDVEYYPCLPVVRSRSDYCLDDTTPKSAQRGVLDTHPYFMEFS